MPRLAQDFLDRASGAGLAIPADDVQPDQVHHGETAHREAVDFQYAIDVPGPGAFQNQAIGRLAPTRHHPIGDEAVANA